MKKVGKEYRRSKPWSEVKREKEMVKEVKKEEEEEEGTKANRGKRITTLGKRQ